MKMMRIFMTMLCSLLAVCSVSAQISRQEGADGQAAIYRLPLMERAFLCLSLIHIYFNIDNMLTNMRQYYRGGRYDFLLNSTENIIRVKATVRNFPNETNMSVITEDGSFYTLNVKYAAEPLLLNVETVSYTHLTTTR